jgi:hypothetical protein
VAILTLKLKKEELQFELAKYQAGQLIVKAPEKGIALFDSPEEWEGHPVKMGEKILIIANAHHTKVQIWIPENDNVALDFSKPVKLILNVSPTSSLKANLIYVASYSTLSDKSIPSFIAEANWEGETPPNLRMGLKGTAILYGDNVSIFYTIIRRPWAYFRNLIGV